MKPTDIQKHLSRLVSAAYLGIFRILFGLVMVLQFQSHFVRAKDYGQEGVTRFFYPGLDFIPPADETTFRILLWTGILAALFMSAGFLFRLATGIVFLIFSYIQLQDALHYNNHYYFFSLVCFLFLFTHADRRFSFSPFRENSDQPSKVIFLEYFLLMLMIFIVYFYGGIAKLNGDWLSASVTKFMWPGVSESMALFIAWSGMLFDLFIGFLLFFRKTRWPAIILSVIFHLTNALLFFDDIHLFPWAMIAATFLFVEPDWWDRFFIKKQSSKKAKSSKTKKAKKPKEINSNSTALNWPAVWAISVLIAFFAFQFLFPLRHYFIPGNVDWTGQGHYMAWRMKSYHKDASIRFSSHDPNSGQLIKDYGNLGLGPEAEQRIGAFPHLVLQLAKEVNRQLTEGAPSPPRLKVDYRVAFNGRNVLLCIDPEMDVNKSSFRIYQKNDWILAFD